MRCRVSLPLTLTGMALFSAGWLYAQSAPLPIVPYPAQVVRTGEALTFAALPIVLASDVADAELARLAHVAAETLADPLTRTPLLAVTPTPSTGGVVALAIDSSLADTSREAYALVADSAGVRITARDYPGIFYGIQTLRQIVASSGGGWTVPAVHIVDRPRFSYRGLHLDVSRHFFPAAFVKRYIDLMARYKLNRFHWHLTDDQGWRIEIKRYPRLTSVGGYRKETEVAKNREPYVGDGTPYGGYYTQEEIKDVVAYAAERHVTVVPEIEMPGHALAALAAYPDLACTPGPFALGTHWGVFEDIFCPTPHTFDFLEHVLSEVMELFPGPYIHVGGDEVPKRRWHESATAQAVMRREGLTTEDQLQSYFTRTIEAFLRSHGRRLVGWDEILEGGIPQEATVMSWRGMDGGIAAAQSGHDVIMTPGNEVYFDYYQGDPEFEPLAIGGYTPLDTVYQFDPVPPDLTPDQARHVLGTQANVWTEYIPTEAQAEYMVFPRLLALAEVAWSPKAARDWESFQARLPARLAALDRAGVQYRIPQVQGLDQDVLTLDSTATLTLSSILPTAAIHYTLDGAEPTAASPVYAGPVTVALDSAVRAEARLLLPNGRPGPIRAAWLRHATLRAAESLDSAAVTPGLEYAYYETPLTSAAQLAGDSLTPTRTGTTPQVALLGSERDEQFALRLSGFVHVPTDGIYQFTLRSDDGSLLLVDDSVVVDNDGPHVAVDHSGSVALQAGYHRLIVAFFQATGGKALGLLVTPPGGQPLPLPPAWLFRRPAP
jgi:hexosaminidase